MDILYITVSQVLEGSPFTWSTFVNSNI